jgi:dTDP-glucose 4,6-dehydratase
MPKPRAPKIQNPKSKIQNPTSVVTGGAGFLGSHLVDLLLAKGHRVIAIDNLITGSIQNIDHLSDLGGIDHGFHGWHGWPAPSASLTASVPSVKSVVNPSAGERSSFKFIQHDVTEFIYLHEPVDYIWHFASPASPIDYLQLPIQTLKVGSLGTHKALGLAKQKKARFLLASTSEIYGDPLIHPQPETYWGNVNTLGPRGCYDEAKRFAEALTLAYARQHQIDTRIVRIFNTYGPRMRLNDGRVVPAFLGQALKNKPITIFGDGSQTRSFCYYTDLIEGIYRLMMMPTPPPEGRAPSSPKPKKSHQTEFAVVNIGNPHELTMLQFAREVIRATKSKSKITFKPLPQDDPKQRQPDITRARDWLGWEPQVPLTQGLKTTIAYFRPRV